MSCFFRNLQLLNFEKIDRLFELVEQFMKKNTFLFNITQFEKTGLIGKTFFFAEKSDN